MYCVYGIVIPVIYVETAGSIPMLEKDQLICKHMLESSTNGDLKDTYEMSCTIDLQGDSIEVAY